LEETVNKDLFMGFYLACAGFTTLVCTIFLALTLHALLAVFTGIFTLALAVFSVVAFNAYRSNRTNMF
jgi:hypothetical protein